MLNVPALKMWLWLRMREDKWWRRKVYKIVYLKIEQMERMEGMQ